MSGRYLHTLWCDDIRQEVGNKLSFMGAYTAGLVVPQLPIVMPRLSGHCWVVTPKDQPFERLTLKVIRDDGEKLVEFTADPAVLKGSTSPSASEATDRIAVLFGFTMEGAHIPAGCKYIRCVADTEQGELEGNRLTVQCDPSFFVITPPQEAGGS